MSKIVQKGSLPKKNGALVQKTSTLMILNLDEFLIISARGLTFFDVAKGGINLENEGSNRGLKCASGG